ncbi:hypothetical protein BX285_1427 [Streptomyces sp. 1114.5]|uniref:DUF6039 family protein n=1 Tax=unclassified Streptomyces TaxID=2593676 RepID=UPI000BD4B63D|nr:MULTISPECIES: DUF6039 family protein [unclassified Streptomyces]RKT17063.1 hypothetical protein BX285_1427 [Streptomyces sp. 1114.5]SOB83274.1 hypothetical protein SAMN06272789_3476 [Streptomyces sp. 1331.2]
MTAQSVPQAQNQTSLPPEEQLHTVNARVVVERVAQVRAGHRAEALAFARASVERLSTEHAGVLGAQVFEETFGTKDRIHFLIHLDSLACYEDLLRMWDEAKPEHGAEEWNRLFVEGSVQETVLMPQFWGMYGTKVDGELEKQSTVYRNAGPVSLPPAREQSSLPLDRILHSGNAGIVMHRTGQMASEYRSEARQFGRVVAESINKNLPGECTVFVYEEAFGQADQLHWLIHLKDINTYMRLLELHVRDEEVRDIYFRDWIPAEKGGGTWAGLFLDGTMSDVALTPLH